MEDRQLFAASFPTPQEQYMVELINRARANPTAEVQRLAGTGTAPTLLTRNAWTLTSSNNAADLAAAIDGNLGTRWSSNAAMAPGMYFQIDLGSAQAFNRIEMDSTGSSADFAAGYNILVSDTGTDWDTRQPVATGNGLSAKITVVLPTTTARYVRIVQTGTKPEGWWWSLHEVNLLNQATSITTWGGTPDVNEGLPAGTITTAPKQPLAVDPFLTDAARGHSDWMLQTGNLSHLDLRPNSLNPIDRAVTAGYVAPPAPPALNVGENIFFKGGVTDQTVYNDEMQAGLFIDNIGPANGTIASRGHRAQMLNPSAKLLGVGHAFGNNQAFSSTKFTNVNDTRAYLTGVTYRDQNSNNFYTPGEGLGGVTITATRITDGQVFTTTTWDAGGYTLELAEGAYTVTASGGTIGTPAPQTVTITNQNVKVDFLPRDTPPPPPAAAAPTFVQQPASVSQASRNPDEFEGSPLTLTAAAVGTPTPTYQWQSAPAGSSDFTDIAGATATTYTFTPVIGDAGRQFRAVATNSGGSTNSNVATITLTGVRARMTEQPRSQTVDVGQVVTLTSAAVGAGIVPQWSVSEIGAPRTDIPGATSPNYTFTATPDMAGKTLVYRVTYLPPGGDPGFAAQSSAIVTVRAQPVAPAVAAAPVNTTATAGGDATLAAVATGFPQGDIQWQVATPQPDVQSFPANARVIPPTAVSGAAGLTFTDVAGLTGASVTFPVTSDMNGQLYRAVITNAAGTTVTAPVRLTVNDESFIANELANLRQLIAQARQALADCRAQVRADVAALNADLRRLNASRAERRLLSTLSKQEARARANFEKRQNRTFRALTKNIARIDKLFARVQAVPTDAKSQARLDATISALQADIAANTVPADAARCVLAVQDNLVPLAAVAPSDQQLQANVVNASNGSQTIGQQLQAPMALATALIARITNGVQA